MKRKVKAVTVRSPGSVPVMLGGRPPRKAIKTPPTPTSLTDCPAGRACVCVTVQRPPSLMMRTKPMQRVVVALHADYCSRLFDHWYYWYTRVFQATAIHVLTVETPMSPAEKTEAFFRDKPLVQFRKEQWPIFDAFRLWEFKKKWVANQLAPYYAERGPYVIVPADTDEFLEPITEDLREKRGLLPYRHYEFASHVIPAIGDMGACVLTPLSWGSLHKVGLVNIPSCKLLGCHWHPRTNGHVDDQIFQKDKPCYHWFLQGVEQFIHKVKCVTLAPGEAGWHWPIWRKIYETEGEEGLRREYGKILGQRGSQDAAIQKFKQYFQDWRAEYQQIPPPEEELKDGPQASAGVPRGDRGRDGVPPVVERVSGDQLGGGW